MKRTLSFDFKVKKASKGTITIEGLANANTVDRMKEIILPTAWNLDNYKKNPVVLFDHGHDPTFGFMPVGRAVEVEAREDGLYTKIEMSSSKSEKISAIRDLVEEGILKTFSVGFDPKSTAKSETNPDVMEITKAELIETSIVPIPMNQDSTFTMLGRRKAYWQTPLAKKWYDVFMDRVELHKKGAWVAAAVHQRLYDLMEVGEIRNKDSALQFVADEAGTTIGKVNQALSGKLLPVPANLVKAFAGVLRVDSKTLESLNRGDVALLERVMHRDDQGGNDVKKKAEAVKAAKEEKAAKDAAIAAKAKAAARKKAADEEAKEEEDKKDGKEKAMGKICYVAVPKDSVADASEASSKVEAAGYAVDQVEETEEGYIFWQVPKEEAGDVSEGLSLDIGDGIMAHIVATDAKAYDEDKEDEDKKSASEEEEEDKKAMDGEEEEEEEEEEEKAEDEGEDPKMIVEAALAALESGNADEVKILLEKLAAMGELGAKSLKNVDGTDDNPYIKAATAQTAMLGAILNELKGMGEGMKGLADLTVALSKAAGDAKSDDTEEDEDKESKDGEDAKSVDLLRSYQRDLDKKLKRLNV